MRASLLLPLLLLLLTTACTPARRAVPADYAFATYAKTTRLPSVWLYTANDHSSRPPFIQRLHAAYQAAGGHAELHQLPAFKSDGHGLFGDRAGTAIWAPIVSAFLSTH